MIFVKSTLKGLEIILYSPSEHINNKNNSYIMSQEKADIFLSRINDRINRGEFDKDLEIPFASKKMLKSLVKAKMNKKVETGATPILSENDLAECVRDIRETAVFTAAVFLEVGILQENDKKMVEHPRYRVTTKWEEILNPKK